ncbi:hypothetical protein NPIL_481241 [Nephila pilipes]|uniref:Uncharacterized protein n=1 Tax=Nephila pilipes TaxID=299642 RepID=A0A8X6TRH7_NEPPI|nr:hypothetical protein NPIL_481241 [Nephila pilipes]
MWGTTAKSNRNLLQRTQNSFLRSISTAPRYMTVRYIRRELDIPSIAKLISQLSSNFYSNIANHSNSTINIQSIIIFENRNHSAHLASTLNSLFFGDNLALLPLTYFSRSADSLQSADQTFPKTFFFFPSSRRSGL